MTWGRYLEGALGIGHPLSIPAVQPGGLPTEEGLQRALRGDGWDEPLPGEVPMEVKFDFAGASGRSFCVAGTVNGWHSAALIIELDVSLGSSF